MNRACYLQKRRPEKNEQRFYCIHVCQGFFRWYGNGGGPVRPEQWWLKK